MEELQNILNNIEEILKTLYTRNIQVSTNSIEIDVESFRKSSEYLYFEEIIYSLFPYNLSIYIPDILVPVNLKYSQSNTEMLARNLLNTGSMFFAV
ncbi:hypothetical protein NEMIN01_0014 [Nematocida minor]|uniref:uncharacterized protein n=1 Tax=Nematocida minor TaxID=1912983 RepID=UPI002220DF2B|nr:uncharacterized protein NEMIN01_0007 [Nematocida minor]XP_051331916.1 uncharacterized protein NEMIN01_0014 [Nematocida minor]KAI5188743.1 hypothetical protein NEMIN01_0007 [Nematocida minor]KAI5188750.1 hypothetical protein NEMIN01_0014 [Nematocida minor]